MLKRGNSQGRTHRLLPHPAGMLCATQSSYCTLLTAYEVLTGATGASECSGKLQHAVEDVV